MRWQKRITKKQMKHLKETQEGPPTLRGLMNNLKHQRDQGHWGRCYECEEIATRLGLELPPLIPGKNDPKPEA